MPLGEMPAMGTVVQEKTGEAIQRAIDEVSRKGGGIVFLPSGVYPLKSGIRLRSGILLKGEGRATVLRRPAFMRACLTRDIRRGDREVWVENPEGYEAGMEIAFRDTKNAHYSNQERALIQEVAGNRLLLDRGVAHAYLVEREATLTNGFPVLFGCHIEGTTIEALSVDGNRPGDEGNGPGEEVGTASQPSAARFSFTEPGVYPPSEETEADIHSTGIQLSECKHCSVIRCTAYACSVVGISCSGGEGILFGECESYGNATHGFHLGLGEAGATRCTVRNCHGHHNDMVGIYVCWNVTESIFVANHLTNNTGDGFLIGPFDSRNVVANNVISNNGGCGIVAARRASPCESNSFVNNIICDNGRAGETPAIMIESPEEGRYEHFLFSGNVIVETRKPKGARAAAIHIGEQTDYMTISNNVIQGGWKSSVENHSRGKHNSIGST